MIITIAVASGVTHVYMIWCMFSLIWCTMCFGYYTEVTSIPEPTGNAQPEKWKVRAPDDAPWCGRDYWLFKVWRLAAHVLGYVPYMTVWIILGDSFLGNTSEDAGPPDFVYVIVFGQFAVFTCFGITQLVNQFSENGPQWYAWGEWSYLFLSMFSKGLLGMTLVANVFLYGSFAAAVAEAQTETA